MSGYNFEVDKTYEFENSQPFKDIKVFTDLNDQNSILYTFNINSIKDELADELIEFDKFMSFYKPQNLVLVLLDGDCNGAIVWINLNTNKHKYLYVSETTTFQIIKNGMLYVDHDMDDVLVINFLTGKEYDYETSSTPNKIIGPYPSLKYGWSWDDWVSDMSTNAIVENSQLNWNKGKLKYNMSLDDYSITVTDADGKKFTMEQVFQQPDKWIDELLQLNGVQKSTDIINRISAIILINNAGLLVDEDSNYVQKPKFGEIAILSDNELSEKYDDTNMYDIRTSQRFNAIRALLD